MKPIDRLTREEALETLGNLRKLIDRLNATRREAEAFHVVDNLNDERPVATLEYLTKAGIALISLEREIRNRYGSGQYPSSSEQVAAPVVAPPQTSQKSKNHTKPNRR